MDTIDRWREIDEVFREVRGSPPERYEVVLRERCPDGSIREEVLSLLLQAQALSRFLEAPALGADFHVSGAVAAADPLAKALQPGRLVGQYTIRRLIAAGGMAMVYEAQQTSPPRTVAVKVLHRAVSGSPLALRRFHDEARILAKFAHDSIAHVYEFGLFTVSETGELLPFIAMELVPDARTLTAWARERKAGLRPMLRLFLDVCHAVQHGHQRGIIHRDLKPSNILVDGEGRVKVIDFGVARATDRDLSATKQTNVGQIIGTLGYMSPEQCAADPHALDVRSDVYSLGVVLYELISGRPPYEVPTNLLQATRIIQEHVPSRPSMHDPGIGRDLDTIVLTALAKDPHRRYQSVGDLAGDLERYLNRRPINARAPRWSYRFALLLKRNPSLATAIALLVLTCTAGAAAFVNSDLQMRHERDKYSAILEFVQSMFNSPSTDRAGENVRVADVLDDASAALRKRADIDDEVRGELLALFGDTYEAVGQYPRAKLHYELALPLLQRALGEFSPRVVDLTIDVSGSYFDEGDWRHAEALLVEVMQGHIDRHGEMNAVAARAHNDLSLLYIETNRLEEAETHMREALRIRGELFEPGHRLLAQSTFNLGVIRDMRGDAAEAVRLVSEALHVVTQSNSDPISQANFRQYLARVYRGMGELDRANQEVRQALATLREVVGEDHPRLAGALATLAGVLSDQGDLASAERVYRQALDIYHQKYGPDHPYSRTVMTRLADVQRRMERHDGTERMQPAQED
jgi:eukaryotic-like serine/threonine-protein kinase